MADDRDGGDGGGGILAPELVLLLLLTASSAALYAQCTVTEVRFLPALNVLCHRLGVPPDVAAATLMSAGAASPNLLAVLISLFVTHSSLGAGTIVGSEMFQGLFVVAGAILSARSGDVVLNPVTAGRELLFCALSLGMLVKAALGLGIDLAAAADEEGGPRAVVSTSDGVRMLLLYAVYVAVCAKFDLLVRWLALGLGCCRPKCPDIGDPDCSAVVVPGDCSGDYAAMDDGTGDAGEGEGEGGAPAEDAAAAARANDTSIAPVVESDIPFLRQFRHEPSRNFIRGDDLDNLNSSLQSLQPEWSSSPVRSRRSAQEEEEEGGEGPRSRRSDPRTPAGRSDPSGERADPDHRHSSAASLALDRIHGDNQVRLDADGRCVVIGSFDALSDEEARAVFDDANANASRRGPEGVGPAPSFDRSGDGESAGGGSAGGRPGGKPLLLRDAFQFLLLPQCQGPGAAAGGERRTAKMHDLHDLEELELAEDGSSLSCFLWQQSVFYDRTRIGKNAWQLRWFTFHADGSVESIPDRVWCDRSRGRLIYPSFRRVEVDASHLVLRLHSAIELGGGDDHSHSVMESGLSYVLMAPSAEILAEVLERVGSHLQETTRPELHKSPFSFEAEVIEAENEATPSLLDPPPTGASLLTVALHYVLFPIKFLMHVTIPDVMVAAQRRAEEHTQDPTEPLVSAVISILSCIAWLICNSFIMVTSLERVGLLLDIPDSVVGITISAIGTSIPVFIASTVAARQGLGNMAISNAFASNTFNILIGLGLPWTLYCLFVSDDGTYDGMSDGGGIVDSIMILALSLVATVLMILHSQFVLYRWHAWVLVGFYILYLVYAVGRVYVLDVENEGNVENE